VRYVVGITQRLTRYHEIVVEAKNMREASEKAFSAAEDYEHWDECDEADHDYLVDSINKETKDTD